MEGHKLSVTQLAFSHSGEWLLSGSRDRQWCLFRRVALDQSGVPRYQLFHVQAKAHDRIIWSVSWSHDDRYFATASRDKSVRRVG